MNIKRQEIRKSIRRTEMETERSEQKYDDAMKREEKVENQEYQRTCIERQQ